MPISIDLSNLVDKFKTMDPKRDSLNAKLEKIPKRTRLQNFFGLLVYILTFTLRSKNPQLDQAAKKCTACAEAIFKQPLTTEEKTALIRTFTALKTIVEKNGGGEKGKIVAFIKKIQALQALATPSPDKPVPAPNKSEPAPPAPPVPPREPNSSEIKLTRYLETHDFSKESGLGKIRPFIGEVEMLAPSSKKTAELYENLFKAYAIDSAYLVEDIARLKPAFFKTFLENLLASPHYDNTWKTLMWGLPKSPVNTQVFVDAFPSHQDLPALADMNYRQRITKSPPIGAIAADILNSNVFKNLFDNLEEKQRLTLLQNLVPYAARYFTRGIGWDPRIKDLFDLPNHFPAYRKVILEGLSQTTNGANFAHLILQDGFDPEWMKQVLANNPPDRLERCVDDADRQKFQRDPDPFFDHELSTLFDEKPVKKELEQQLIAELQQERKERLFQHLRCRPSHIASRFEWLPQEWKSQLTPDELIAIAKISANSKAVLDAFIQSPDLCRLSLNEDTLWKLFDEGNVDLQVKVIHSVFAHYDTTTLMPKLEKASLEAWRRVGLEWKTSQSEKDNLALIVATPSIVSSFLNGISENKNCDKYVIVATVLKLNPGIEILKEFSPEVIELFNWSQKTDPCAYKSQESEQDFYFYRVVQALQQPQEPKESALLLKLLETIFKQEPTYFHFVLKSLSRVQVEQLSKTSSQMAIVSFFILLLGDKADEAKVIADRFTAQEASQAFTICQQLGQAYLCKVLKSFNPAQDKLSAYEEKLGNYILTAASSADDLLKLPRSFLMRNLKLVYKLRIELLSKLPAEEARQALDSWWDRIGPELDLKLNSYVDFPFGRMICLSDDSSKIETLAAFYGDRAYQLIGSRNEYVLWQVLGALEQAPWKFWMALPKLDRFGLSQWNGGTGDPRQLYSKCFEILDWYCNKSTYATKAQEIADFSQKLNQAPDVKMLFESAEEMIKQALLAPIVGPSPETLAENFRLLKQEQLTAAMFDKEARQKLIQTVLTGRGPFSVKFPTDFLEEMRKAANPWGSIFLDPAVPYAGLKLNVGARVIPVDRMILNLDANLSGCFVQNGETFTVKPDKAIEAQMRLDWLYGRISASDLLNDLGQKILFENKQKPLSLNQFDSASSDITIKVEGKEIKAHKCILASLDFFAAAFRSGFKEVKGHMELNDITYDQTNAVLKALYEGKLPQFSKKEKQQQAGFYKALKYLNGGRTILGK